MSIYKRHGSDHWLLDVIGPDGRRVRKSSGTADRQLALHKEAQLRLSLDADQVFDIPRPSTNTSLGELAEQFLTYQRQIHPRSVESYYLHPVQFFTSWLGHGTDLGSICLADLHAFQAELVSRSSNSNANRSIAVVRSLFRLAVEWGLLQKSPAAGIKRFKEPGGRRRFLTREEQAKVLRACKEPFRSVVLVALRTGMRRAELLGLRVRDVDFLRSHLSLYKTKTDSARHIPMLPEVRETLLALSKNLPDDAFLFRSKWGRVYTPGGVKTAWERIRHQVGLRDVHFHDLRHTFASDCLAAGVPLVVLRDWMGHSSVKTTELYAHLAEDTYKSSLSALDRHLAAHFRQTPPS